MIKNDKELQGNVTLSEKELIDLKEAILKRYFESTGREYSYNLNSNLKNYKELFDHIDSKVSLKENDIIKSVKPLALIFYFSSIRVDSPRVFRKKLINALYEYAFLQSRESYRASTTTLNLSVSNKAFTNIVGYWECYYDKKGDFHDQLRSQKKAVLGKIAYCIYRDDKGNIAYQFYQSKDSGKGAIKVKGSNVFFKSDDDGEEQFVSMNCGLSVETYPNPIERMVGCFHHIDDAGAPKAGRCVMFHIDPLETRWNIERNTPNEQFADYQEFTLEDEEDKKMNDLRAYFFEKETNTLTANLHVYKEFINSAKFAEFKQNIK